MGGFRISCSSSAEHLLHFQHIGYVVDVHVMAVPVGALHLHELVLASDYAFEDLLRPVGDIKELAAAEDDLDHHVEAVHGLTALFHRLIAVKARNGNRRRIRNRSGSAKSG